MAGKMRTPPEKENDGLGRRVRIASAHVATLLVQLDIPKKDDMAKIPHRIFEIYESCAEATRALTPKSVKTATESTAPESWVFEHLSVSRSAGVTHVQFTKAEDFGEETVAGLRADFAQLADALGIDNKVLVDFTGVVLFSAPFIDALAVFSKKLRTKGSRIALCGLAPAARQSFFLPDDANRS
jgi:anti-anti-sigma regulatory factor